MSLIAEFRLTGTAIPMAESLSAVPEMSIHVEQAVAEDPERPEILAWARGDDFAALEAALEEDESIAEYAVLESIGEERLYRFQISPAAEIVFYAIDVEVGASRLDVVASHEGLDMRMRFPDQDALQEYFDRCREQDVSVSLRRLYRDESGDATSEASDDYGLSAKQRRALEAAYRRGFFEVPREASLSDVAGDLEVSEQVVSERLRRATGALIRTTLDPTPTDEPPDGTE